ncbi:hypothetical protein [Corynebacterium aquilae]|uniref:Head-to-tail adaptor n=1 Tax=Corynebacterium aquilae DSM 44791 TaxID=1431546 RepID=A0A1L7CHS9_9CORY|nr:hypothetical protein [Corynebacterium aquilae]APT85323.1 hypothetical protein CAQU_09880 [Corynebacterium aquilae DSM 44791]
MSNDHGLTPTEKITAEAIETAVEAVRMLAGWHVWPVRRETITLRAAGDRLILLPTKRVEEVHAVTVDGVDVTDSADAWEDGELWLRDCPREGARVVVDFSHGFPEAPPLMGVCMAMAERSADTSSSYQVGGISVGPPGSALTPQSTEWVVLDRYKLGPIP